MQMKRLFEITYLLLGRRKLTARELAARFEVSERTIYRDIDALSAAGIPVYAVKGKGGGIRLLDDFVLDRSLLSDAERDELMFGLQSLAAVQYPDLDGVLEKLGALFRREDGDWVDVDLSGWEGDGRDWFGPLKTAILGRRVARFAYYGSDGAATARLVEPLRLLFKGRGWYLYAFCRLRGDYRLFKLNRIHGLAVTDEIFEREPPGKQPRQEPYTGPFVDMLLKIGEPMAYRVYDEFPPDAVERLPEGGFLVRAAYPPGEWVYSQLLSFGPALEVLEPPEIRDGLRARLQAALRAYE